MDFLKDVSVLDMVCTDLDEQPKKRTKVNCNTRPIASMRSADRRSMHTCYECKKRFCAKVPCGDPWPYKETRNGKKRWFCTYTCLSIYRKGNTNGSN